MRSATLKAIGAMVLVLAVAVLGTTCSLCISTAW
jgi:hypothetical protein